MSTPHSTPPGSESEKPQAAHLPGPADDDARDLPREEDGSAPGPVADDAAAPSGADAPGERHGINPARMEVRVRRLALLGLVLVPVVYFVVQSLR